MNKESYNNECKNNSYPKPVVAFDLDETLIHCYSLPPRASGISTIPIRMGRNCFYVATRPGLREFLDKIEDIYEVFIYTCSHEVYANKIIEKIAPEIDNDHRLCRKSCITNGSYHIKDLSKLCRPLNKLFLVDDMASAAELQKHNLIRIKPYMGEREDKVLNKELLPALEFCCCAEDIRCAAKKVIADRKYTSIAMH